MTTTGVQEPRRTRVPVQDSPAPDVVPFGWEPGPDDLVDEAGDEVFFRFPTPDDPAPGTRRLLAMSLYAALLGLAGVGIGIRGMVSQIGGGVPGWYVPVLAFLGMVSVALSVGAFLSIHRRILPWLLLLGAAVPLIADIMLAVAY
ncbi:hypothetical protein GCM10020358_18230 [Amorphoplanes nipponensis]|uniref:Uncharacterized protein n=1 Tax=Actinoplanes nipponensis TaxID=135950 RepID=A0A919MPT4_9ACTN|nr:hypothetical protein [Actinoplanes nipponensis]GIE52402.1 hypothetical protein Ani05nite_59360 [Actinoplanes nipponensis]